VVSGKSASWRERGWGELKSRLGRRKGKKRGWAAAWGGLGSRENGNLGESVPRKAKNWRREERELSPAGKKGKGERDSPCLL